MSFVTLLNRNVVAKWTNLKNTGNYASHDDFADYLLDQELVRQNRAAYELDMRMRNTKELCSVEAEVTIKSEPPEEANISGYSSAVLNSENIAGNSASFDSNNAPDEALESDYTAGFDNGAGKMPYDTSVIMKMPGKGYKCGVCEKTFNSRPKCEDHQFVHTGVKQHKCSYCKKEFTTRNVMANHINWVHKRRELVEKVKNPLVKAALLETLGDEDAGDIDDDENLDGDKNGDGQVDIEDFATKPKFSMKEGPRYGYFCHICMRRFTRRNHRDEHMLTHGGPRVKRFKCNLCECAYVKKSQLKCHMRRHTGELPYACDICGKRFHASGIFRRHVARHSDVRSYICALCGKAFKNSSTLYSHNRIHTGELVTCKFCGKQFSSNNTLKRHEREHSTDRIFCDQCDASFTTQPDLTNHMASVHLNLREFKCEQCPKEFNLKRQLARHIRTVHLETRPYHCTYCEERFKTLRIKQRHEAKHTGLKQFQCEMCNMAFAVNDDLIKHRKRHKDKQMKQHQTTPPQPQHV